MVHPFPPILVACIDNEDEALTCRQAGLPVVASFDPHAMMPSDGEDQGGGAIAVTGLGTLAVWVDHRPAVDALARVAAEGAAGVLLLSRAPRVLDARPLSELEGVAAEAAALGLRLAVAGGIEPPDVPRVLALGVTVLIVGRALRQDRRPGAPLDPARIATMRDLLVAAGPRDDADGPPLLVGSDRIFVRDFVVTMSVGAYGWERGAPQRVRFAVEADLTPARQNRGGLADVVSYDLITDAILALAGGGHVDLVETLAEAVAGKVLAHPRVGCVRVRVEKLDLGPHVVGVEITRARAVGA